MERNSHKYPRSERLKSRKTIGRLFDRNAAGNISFPAFPLRVVVFREEPEEAGYPEILISVPKRSFKKAVDRNRIKRLIREAYRLQKISFPRKTCIAFLYVGKEVPGFGQVEKAMGAILDKLSTL